MVNYSQNEDFSTEFIPELRAGTIDGKCLVSSSGYGDGMYSLYAARNEDGAIVGLKLVFIEWMCGAFPFYNLWFRRG